MSSRHQNQDAQNTYQPWASDWLKVVHTWWIVANLVNLEGLVKLIRMITWKMLKIKGMWHLPCSLWPWSCPSWRWIPSQYTRTQAWIRLQWWPISFPSNWLYLLPAAKLCEELDNIVAASNVIATSHHCALLAHLWLSHISGCLVLEKNFPKIWPNLSCQGILEFGSRLWRTLKVKGTVLVPLMLKTISFSWNFSWPASTLSQSPRSLWFKFSTWESRTEPYQNIKL